MDIPLQNIYNFKRKIFLFNRLDDGRLQIEEDNTFHPYFFEPDEKGYYKGYDGSSLRKVTCSEPRDVREMRTDKSYEADIIYTKRYLIDKVDTIKKSPIKYMFLDIENLADQFPDPSEAKYPISCITTYNSFSAEYKQFFLGDYPNEISMLNDFCDYIYKEKPDLCFAWNMNNFDYPYLNNRINNFSKKISPIRYSRWQIDKKSFYPAGISICDYYEWYKRIKRGLKKYTLDYVLQEEFGQGKKYAKIDFSKLSNEIKERNFEDVKGMVEIEKKNKIIEQFDERRRFAIVEWEDLCMNSRGIDVRLLKQAKKCSIVLPSKSSEDEAKDFEGAYREAFKTGVFKNLGKYDLSGAYLYTIIDFCLDSVNIKENSNNNTIKVNVTDRVTNNLINSYNIEQNDSALLPTIVKEVLEVRNKYKKLRSEVEPGTLEYKERDNIYNAVKEFALSYWGVIGNRYFRYYDHRVVSMITSVVRDLLHYVKYKLEEGGYEVIYIDTDSFFVNDGNHNIVTLLNQFLQEWSLDRFKKNTNIKFEYEGRFTKLFILGKCHYYSYIDTGKGIKPEIKGMEIKRSSSSEYESYFQENILERILNGESKEDIIKWMKSECDRIKTLGTFKLAFPCKIGTKEYKVKTIVHRAYNNSTKFEKNFFIPKGESFYYIPVRSLGKDEDGKPINVLAINEEYQFSNLKDYIDWDQIIRRTILNKSEAIFKVLNWGQADLILSGLKSLDSFI